MKKKKILGIIIATAIGISSIVPAFADTTVSQSEGTSTTQTEIKQLTQQEKFEKLTQRAAKLGIDTNGLTNEQVREKIREAEAAKLGIDITGLTKEEAKAKIKAAIETKKQEITEKLTQKAVKLGIDITGLNGEQVREKIREAEAAKLGIDYRTY